MASFPFDRTTISLSIPDPRASSIPYCRIGLSTRGSISFGITLVAGKNRVPKPAQGKTQVRRVVMSRGRIAVRRGAGGGCRVWGGGDWGWWGGGIGESPPPPTTKTHPPPPPPSGSNIALW